MATSATGDSEVGDRSSPAEAMQGDWDFADNGAGASHHPSEQDAADGLQHDVDKGRVRGGECRTPTTLPVTMVQECPTVNEERGDMLMDLIEAEEKKKTRIAAIPLIEAEEKKKTRIAAILGKETEPETEYEKNVAETQKMFPDVPAYLIQNVA